MLYDSGWKKCVSVTAILLLVAAVLVFPLGNALASEVRWLEYPSNPIYDPTAHRAYYPCVLYDPNGFSGHGASFYYKMWYGGYSYEPGAMHNQALVYSNDGVNWSAPVEMQGMASSGYHAKILFIPSGYGAGPYYYKMWYWSGSMTYTINDLRTADSADGVNWVNDQVPTQDATYPLVDNVGTPWNRGTYGPAAMLYNPSATNTGTNPFNYTFTLYYDATTGGQEVIGLAYSANGNHWTRYHIAPYEDAPVLDHGAPGSWDSDYATNGTVIPNVNGEWHMWYSGSGPSGGGNEGIGYATSPDGINWTRDPYNPALHISNGIPWRNLRTYTPSVLYSATQFDGHGGSTLLKMWYTGVTNPATPNYAVGYAERSNIIPVGPTRKYTTIQAAASAAFPGDIIQVDPGTYNESLLVTKSLTIQSVSSASDTFIDGTGLAGSGLPLFAGSLRALVAVAPPNASGSPYHMRIEGFTIRNSQRIGMGANGNSRGTVRLEFRNCRLTSNTEDDIFLNDVDATAGGLSVIQGCDIEPSGNSSGLYIDGCDYLTVSGNTFSDAGGAGTWGLGAQQCTNLRVEENTFQSFDQVGLIFQASSASAQPLDDNFVQRNTFQDCSGNITLTQYQNNAGLGDLAIRNNFFSGSYNTGILLDPGSYTPGAISGVAIEDNSFSGATSLSADNRYPSPVDSEGNWWGSSSPTSVRSQVSAGVDYSPWLASGTDIDPGTPGFQGDFSNLWVDDDSPQIGAATAIQEGIDTVLSGGTLTAAPGTYNEQVYINKALTVRSASGAAATVINGDDGWPYVVRIQTSNITFDGFNVTNPEYTGGSDASGIIVTESPSITNVRIANCIVHDIGTPTRSPVVYGTVGINLGQCHNVEVDNCEIYNIKHGFVDPTNNYWAQGISIWGMDAVNMATDINIHDCYIHDVSSPNNKDSAVGIQGNVSGIVIQDNVMENTGEYGVDTWNDWGGAASPTIVQGNDISGASLAGIKIVYPGANPITGNALEQCGVGILITASGGASSLRFNDLVNCVNYGIENQSGATLDASWCYWDSPHGPSYNGITYGESFSGNLTWRPYLNAPYGGTPPATPIQITTASSLPAGMTNASYSVDLDAAGGTAPYGWFIYSGSLPPGLNLSGEGTLSGIPTSSGDFTLTIEAGDGQQADFKQFSLHIDVGQFAVNASVSGGHGTVQPSFQTIDYGGTASVDIIPAPGYNIASIVDNGAVQPIADPYVIQNVTSDHDVVVTFTQLDVIFQKTASPAGDVVRGQVITYTLQLINNDTLPVTACSLSDVIPTYTGYVENSTALNGTHVQDVNGTSPLVSGLEVHSSGESAGVVAPGGQVLVAFTVQTGNDLPLGASIRNVASAQMNGMASLEASCVNNSSSELPSTWYFAEGSTQAGFDEYILLSNMSDSDMTATITYISQGIAEQSFNHLLPAHSRQTVYANGEMPNRAELSAIVTGSAGLLCERAMYYRYNGIGGGDDVIGANAPSIDLFFAEGFTGSPGNPFDEWILVLNPGSEPAGFAIDYLFPGGDTLHKQYAVSSRQRLSINVDREIGEGREVSAHIHSDQPLVAERTMYFSYKGAWPGGHCGMAATGTRNDWYLAEGYTGWAGSQFDEWIVVANQNDLATPVTVTYMFPDGSTRDFNYTAAAHGRLTISADADVGENQMISAHIHAHLPVVVERPMYFSYGNKWRGGHNCLGAPSPASELYFAEGFTGNSGSQFETWLPIQNTSGEQKKARLDYLLTTGEVFSQEVTLPPHSRTTIFANQVLGYRSLEFSVRIISLDGSPTLLAERAMYFSYRTSFGTCQGGHDVIGY